MFMRQSMLNPGKNLLNSLDTCIKSSNCIVILFTDKLNQTELTTKFHMISTMISSKSWSNKKNCLFQAKLMKVMMKAKTKAMKAMKAKMR